MSRLPLEQMIASLRPLSSSPKVGTIGAVSVVVMTVSLVGSHATAGLGQPGDVGHLLGRLLGEEGEQLLGRVATECCTPAQRRGLAVLGEAVAQEPARLPVRGAHLDADLGGERRTQVFGPLGVLGHEALVVDVYLVSVDRGG